MSASSPLIIVAAGAFAREVMWAAEDGREPFEIAGFIDDDPSLTGTAVNGARVLGTIADWPRFADAQFVIAIGPPRAKLAVHRRMLMQGTPRFATVVHRSVQMSRRVEIGEGSIVCAGVSITTEVTLGRHVIVNLNSTIGHDCALGDYTTLAPLVAMSGRVKTGAGVEIGTGAALLQGVSMGEGAMIGMGSVLTKAVPANALWLGNPAAERRSLEAFG